MSWTDKYSIGNPVKYTEPSGYVWDGEITDVQNRFIQVKWERNRRTHPQWKGFNAAYSTTWTRLWDESRVFFRGKKVLQAMDLKREHIRNVQKNIKRGL